MDYSPTSPVWSASVPSFADAIKIGESLDFGKSNLGGGKSGGGSSMVNPWVAGASVGLGFIEGFLNRGAAERTAANQQALAKFGFDSRRQTGLDVAKANLGQTMYGANVASRENDLHIGRLVDVEMFRAGPLADAFREAKRRDMQADFGFRTSAPFREAEQRANIENRKNAIAQTIAPAAFMFGEIGPIDASTLIV